MIHALAEAALACVKLSEVQSNYQAEVGLHASLLVWHQQPVPKRAGFHGLATVGESPHWVSPRQTPQRPVGSLWSAFAAFARGSPTLGAFWLVSNHSLP